MMVQPIADSGFKIRYLVLEFILGMTVECMKVNGWTTTCQAWDHITGAMAVLTLGNTLRTKSTAMAHTAGKI